MFAGSILPGQAKHRTSHNPRVQFINMELVDAVAFLDFTEHTFATDRNLVPKGMVEIVP